jgi:Ca2+-binding EF-hand superfamily protein
LINEMDRDKSGQISYQEFKNLLSDWTIIYNNNKFVC